MSNLGSMELKVQADISNLQSQLNKAATTTTNFSNKVNNSLTNVSKGSNYASDALINIGRVAQDSSFGFIGIANNINPLLESFQRLRAESGSTKVALKSLGASLLGGGGLGLAVSVFTAVLQFSELGLSRWGAKSAEVAGGNEKHAQSVNILKDSYERFSEELIRVVDSLGAEQSKALILFEALGDVNLNLKERKNIIESLNKLSPEYLGNLNKETSTYAEAAAAVKSYVESLAKQAEIKALLPEFEKIVKRVIDAQVELNQLRRFQGKDKADRAESIFGLPIDVFKQEEKRLLDAIRGGKNEIKAAYEGYAQIAGGKGILAKILFGESNSEEAAKNITENAKNNLQSISTVIADLGRQIDVLNAKGIIFGTNEGKEKIAAIKSTIEKLVQDFNVSPDDTIIGKLTGTAFNDLFLNRGLEGVTRNIQGLQQEVKKVLETQLKTPTELNIPILPKIEAKPISQEEFRRILRADALNEGAASLAAEISQTIGNAFSEAFTGALSGGNIGNVFGGFFKTIFESLGRGLQQLAIQTEAAQILIKKLRDLFGSSAGIGASIALFALGGLIRALGNSINVPGFAGGGDNIRGGLIRVGERGSELIRVPSGSDVIPNHALNSIGASSTMIVGEIRGDKMLLLMERAAANKKRST